MAYATQNITAGNGLAARLGQIAHDIAERVRLHRVYRQTYTELAQLSDRELTDLGLHRSMLRRVAADSARGA